MKGFKTSWLRHSYKRRFCWGVPLLRHRLEYYWDAKCLTRGGEDEVAECRRCGQAWFAGRSRPRLDVQADETVALPS